MDFKPIFKDHSLNNRFIEEGFVVLQIDLQILEALQNIFTEYVGEPQKGMNVSHYNDDFERNLMISNKIESALIPCIENYFTNYQKIIGHFVYKAGNTNSTFNLHRDWSYVEERNFLAGHMWIPHAEVTQESGTMFVLPKTHLEYKLRSAYYGINERNWTDELAAQVLPVNLKKGEFLFYHPALLHGSYPNSKNSPRINTLYSLTHKEAQLLYFEENNETIKIAPHFFLGEHYRKSEAQQLKSSKTD